MEQNILDQRPRNVRMRFELAAQRLVEVWLDQREIQVSAEDLAMAREFLEDTGYKIEQVGAYVRVIQRDGATLEMSREDTVVLAVRRLAARGA